MKAVLIVLALIVVLGVAFGFYRGWFDFSSRNDVEGNPSITVSVDKDRIEADKDTVVDKIAETTRKRQD